MTKSILLPGGFDGQLVWFKNPGAPFFQTTWVPHVIASGPDVYLTPATLPIPDGELDTILIPGYFFRRLSVYWIESNGTWTNPDVVNESLLRFHNSSTRSDFINLHS